jgi:hypothetical protein
MKVLQHRLTAAQLDEALSRFIRTHCARFADYSPSATQREDGAVEVGIRPQGMLVQGTIARRSPHELVLTVALPRPLEPYFLTRSETLFEQVLRECLDACA